MAKENIKNVEDFIYTVDGLAQDLCFALRKTDRQKLVRCPNCGKQLTSIDISTKIEIFCRPEKANVVCHEYRRCNACRETVGIIFAST